MKSVPVELLPCPFCGGEGKRVPGECIICCTVCYSKTIDTTWNRRAALGKDAEKATKPEAGLREALRVLRVGIWSMIEWAYSEGQHGSNWGDYTGAAASEKMEKLIAAALGKDKERV